MMTWEDTYEESYIWYCGDEICDCYQPVIEEVSPNRKAGHPWVKRRRVWEGTFFSRPHLEEHKEMAEELRIELRKRNENERA